MGLSCHDIQHLGRRTGKDSALRQPHSCYNLCPSSPATLNSAQLIQLFSLSWPSTAAGAPCISDTKCGTCSTIPPHSCTYFCIHWPYVRGRCNTWRHNFEPGCSSCGRQLHMGSCYISRSPAGASSGTIGGQACLLKLYTTNQMS